MIAKRHFSFPKITIRMTKTALRMTAHQGQLIASLLSRHAQPAPSDMPPILSPLLLS